METVKTASFACRVNRAEERPGGVCRFGLDGRAHPLDDVFEILAMGTRHGSIVIR